MAVAVYMGPSSVHSFLRDNLDVVVEAAGDIPLNVQEAANVDSGEVAAGEDTSTDVMGAKRAQC